MKMYEKVWKRAVMRAVMTMAVFVMWAVFLPMRAEASQSGTIGTQDEEGNVLSYSYDEEAKTLTITGTGELGSSLTAEPFSSMEIIKIKFENCKVSGSMAGAFREMRTVEEIDFSGLDTSGVTDMSYMFYGCSGLTSVDVSGFDTTNVTNMSAMFYGCSGLTSVDVSGFYTTNVTSMGGMFKGCSGLTSVDVSGFDTKNVTKMGSMFSGCSGLTSVDVSGFNTTNVTDMYGMFSGCRGLTSVDVSSFDTTNVTNMELMFYDCSGLTSVDVSGFDTTNVTDMGWMFHYCKGLTSVDVSGFDTTNVTNMIFMFGGCSGLTSVDVSGFDTTNVTHMSSMFSGCNGLTSVDVSRFDTTNVTHMSRMFGGCSGLTSVDVSSFDTSRVTDMSGMFYKCSGLTSVDVSNFDTSRVTNMDSMFYGCRGLTSVDVSGFDTTNVTSMYYMFGGCSGLTSVDVSGFDTTNVTSMRYMFSGCSGLKTIKTPRAIAEGMTTSLPAEFYDADVYESTGEYVVTSELNSSYAGKTLKLYEAVGTDEDGSDEEDSDTTDVSAEEIPDGVLYVSYEYLLQDGDDGGSGVTYSISDGTLPAGMELKPNGELCGIPMETGNFKFTVVGNNLTVSGGDGGEAAAEQKTYSLTVLVNSDTNAESATDSGYEIIERVPDFSWDSISSHTLVSVGEYSEFRDVYIDGVKLTEGEDYTSEAGSTRVTIRSETLARFSDPGTHTIVMEFRTSDTSDLKRAVQNYYVFGDSGDADNDDKSDVSGGSGTSASDNDDESEADDGNSAEGSADAAASGTTTVIDYIVQPGDTLWKIAGKFYGKGSYWEKIYMDNKDVIKNPGRIHVGQHIKIYLKAVNSAGVTSVESDTKSGNYYTVQPGDNLWKIASKVYGQSRRWREIYEANRNVLSDPGRIYAKQVLMIP